MCRHYFGKPKEQKLVERNKIEPQATILNFTCSRPEEYSAQQNRPSPSLACLDTKTEAGMNFVRGEAGFCGVFASMVNDHMLINVAHCLGF